MTVPQPLTDKGVASRARAAVALRVAGASPDEIAETLGYTSGRTVMGAIERELGNHVAEEDRRQQRQLASMRLEKLIASVWPKAMDPDSSEHLPAVRAVKELIDRHAKLWGLDAPAEVIVTTPATHELQEWVAMVLSQGQEDVIEADVLEGWGEIEAGADPDHIRAEL